MSGNSEYVAVRRSILEDIREHRHDPEGVDKALGLILDAEVGGALAADTELEQACKGLAEMLSAVTGERITSEGVYNSIVEALYKQLKQRAGTWGAQHDAKH